MSTEYFVLSVKHTTRGRRFISLWGPNSSGYYNRIHAAGRYSAEEIHNRINYYNDGCDSIAVPCEILDSMKVPAPEGWFDTNDGHVVENNRANWQKLIKSVISEPKHKCRPEYPRARKIKESI